MHNLFIFKVDIWQNDIDLIHEIEADLGKKLEKFECKENEVLEDITKVSFHSSLQTCSLYYHL